MAEHNTLTGSSLHEPKGVASANLGEVYRADGAGSGVWQQPPVVTHGEMLVQSYATPFPIGAAVDTTLNTDTDYIKITGSGMWQAGHLHNVTFNVDELIVPVDGEYEIHFWACINVDVTSTTVGVKFAINDTTPYSVRKIIQKTQGTSSIENLSGFGYVGPLSASDTLSLYIAADKNCNVVGKEAGFTVKLLEAT